MLNHTSGESEYSMWYKILTNQGGPETYVSGESKYSILSKILRNQAAGYAI